MLYPAELRGHSSRSLSLPLHRRSRSPAGRYPGCRRDRRAAIYRNKREWRRQPLPRPEADVRHLFLDYAEWLQVLLFAEEAGIPYAPKADQYRQGRRRSSGQIPEGLAQSAAVHPR